MAGSRITGKKPWVPFPGIVVPVAIGREEVRISGCLMGRFQMNVNSYMNFMVRIQGEEMINIMLRRCKVPITKQAKQLSACSSEHSEREDGRGISEGRPLTRRTTSKAGQDSFNLSNEPLLDLILPQPVSFLRKITPRSDSNAFSDLHTGIVEWLKVFGLFEISS